MSGLPWQGPRAGVRDDRARRRHRGLRGPGPDPAAQASAVPQRTRSAPPGSPAQGEPGWHASSAAYPATALAPPAPPVAPAGLTATGPAPALEDKPQTEEHPAGLPEPDTQVPRLLHQSAAWSWRLLLTGLIVFLAFRLAVDLRLVALPFLAAMLLTALLYPLAAWLRGRGFAPVLATWCCMLLALLVIAGVATLVVTQISDQYAVLYDELQRTTGRLQHGLAGPPFHVSATRLQSLSQNLLHYVTEHKSAVAGVAVTGGKYASELGAGLILTLFITFFLLKDGGRIWSWLTSGMRSEARRRTGNAGDQAWRALVNYVRGTTVVAAIHSLLLGLAMWILGVPLLVPLVAMVFIAAFVPIIGILVVGALAIIVALATKGVVAGIILLAVLIVENQIEGHLLQPLVVGRIIKLHPLAIILVLAVGGIVAGIPGAIIAVPVAAVITYAWPALRGRPASH